MSSSQHNQLTLRALSRLVVHNLGLGPKINLRGHKMIKGVREDKNSNIFLIFSFSISEFFLFISVTLTFSGPVENLDSEGPQA